MPYLSPYIFALLYHGEKVLSILTSTTDVWCNYAHTPEDHVSTADLVTSCEVYVEIIRRACCS